MRFPPRLPYVMTPPAMEFMFMKSLNELGGESSNQLGSDKPATRAVNEVSIGELIKYLEDQVSSGAFVREDEVNSARGGLIRRLTYLNHWVFSKTHPLIGRLINGELVGKSVGIDLSWLSPIQRWFYVLSLLAVLNSMQARNLILVIDEAHLYFRLGESTLTTSVRIGRNYNRYFALITQSPFDIPREFISMNKLFVVFSTMFFGAENIVFREVGFRAYFGRNEFYDQGRSPATIMPPHWQPLTALMHLHITNKSLLEMTSEKRPYLELRVEVDPEVKPKTSTTTLRRCAEAQGIRLEVIREGGFENYWHRDRARGGVWECIGRP